MKVVKEHQKKRRGIKPGKCRLPVSPVENLHVMNDDAFEQLFMLASNALLLYWFCEDLNHKRRDIVLSQNVSN